MRGVSPAALFIFLLIQSAVAQTPCDKWSSATVSGSQPITQRIEGVLGKKIYLCGYVIANSGNAASEAYSLRLFTGTGVNCATGQTVLLDTITIPPNQILVNRIPIASGESTPPGHSLCVETGGSGTISVIFYWAQF